MVARAHVFVVMLSYLFVRELRESWKEVDATVAENLSSLSGLCGVRVRVKGGQEISMIPRPRRDLERLFAALGVPPPVMLPTGRTNADTERKLKSRRK